MSSVVSMMHRVIAAPRYAALYSGGRFFPQAPAGMDPVSKLILSKILRVVLGIRAVSTGNAQSFIPWLSIRFS